uniref:hypothetical protein n=1 Tax=uncultured Altererythrobacter sp. TaxID=500840 RepID=UPI00260F1DF2|nr:hypothetical protein [uncultured Altererythrobacter sp.]
MSENQMFGLVSLTRKHWLKATLAFLLLAPATSYAEEPRPDLDELTVQIAPQISKQAIAQIDDVGRRLLALRSYLRASATLSDRWSWTEQEIAEFQGSPEQIALLSEVQLIRDHFASHNPGYEIYANTKVRSLDVQIRRWNMNTSVGTQATHLMASLKAHFLEPGSKMELNPPNLRYWLKQYVLQDTPSLAAPGLTRHGQAKAIDFQVVQADRVVAGASIKQIQPIWIAEGWAERLAESIKAAGPSFIGPLKSPNEPWHYDFRPSLDP